MIPEVLLVLVPDLVAVVPEDPGVPEVPEVLGVPEDLGTWDLVLCKVLI